MLFLQTIKDEQEETTSDAERDSGLFSVLDRLLCSNSQYQSYFLFYQLGEAVCEYAKGNYKQALCLLGSDFNAIDYKVK